MRSERLSQRVSAVTPLGKALDGTPTKPQRAASKATTKPPVGTAYACARCDYRTGDQREYMAHLRTEIKELESELSDVRAGLPRDALGRRFIAECGTTSGEQRHRDRGEPVCEACAAARREHRAHPERREATNRQVQAWRAANRERYLTAQREYRARKKAEDPSYQEKANARRRELYARKKAEQQQAGGEN